MTVVGLVAGNLSRRCAPVSIENTPSLNVYRLDDAGALEPGSTVEVCWQDLAATIYAEQARILVVVGDREQVIPLTRSPQGLTLPCPGEQVYFTCPSCERRAFDLYAGDTSTFACRRCHKLDYLCRHEAADPLIAAVRLRKRVGGSGSLLDPLPQRPKGKAATVLYDQLVVEIAVAEARALRMLRSATTGLTGYAKRRRI